MYGKRKLGHCKIASETLSKLICFDKAFFRFINAYNKVCVLGYSNLSVSTFAQIIFVLYNIECNLP